MISHMQSATTVQCLHCIIGTAGHIDHGKTALVKALTGIDCDTHAEEKRRGITIHLGFAHLDISKSLQCGVIDVPGHAAFIQTMVSGASGIDLFLLVIAADSGIMPQTREHLHILDILGIHQGIIVISKIDLVDERRIAEVAADLKIMGQNTFLNQCPVITVSSTTGIGITQLKQCIATRLAHVTEKKRETVFRLYIDRIFSPKGFGTVVTGSVLGGTLAKGQHAYLLPKNKQLRVRRIERYSTEVDQVVAGDRASINLQGLCLTDFSRGMLIADRALRSTSLFDACIQLFQPHSFDAIWFEAMLFIATSEGRVRIHVLGSIPQKMLSSNTVSDTSSARIDTGNIESKEYAIVQIHLCQPWIVKAGDRFVLRNTANDATLGGGWVIDPVPLNHRRRPSYLLEQLRTLVCGTDADLITWVMRRDSPATTNKHIASLLNMSPREVDQAVLSDNGKNGICLYIHTLNSTTYLILSTTVLLWKSAISQRLRSFHTRFPLHTTGLSSVQIADEVIGPSVDESKSVLFEFILNEMADSGQIKNVNKTWLLSEHDVSRATAAASPLMEKIEEFYKKADTVVITPPEIRQFCTREKIPVELLNDILSVLVSKKIIYHIEEYYIHSEPINRYRTVLLTMLTTTHSAVTVAQFRDAIKGNRRFCLLLFQLFDTEGITIRQGDLRSITEKGRSFAGLKG
ncbi:MAG: selenocysteine-specific translation elongation factor [Chitinivibrionales bacterium]|nr:selenocysteine-specific translation elongation factor [Chitinivibrionales bacterium]